MVEWNGKLLVGVSGQYGAGISAINPDTGSVVQIYTDSYFETGLMTVGTKYQPNTFRFIEVQLGKPLASGEVITLSFRKTMTDSYTSIGTMSYTGDGAIYSKIIENSAVFADQVQFKCVVTVGSSATTGPEIKAIYIN